MGKKIILKTSDVKKIIKESVIRILSEEYGKYSSGSASPINTRRNSPEIGNHALNSANTEISSVDWDGMDFSNKIHCIPLSGFEFNLYKQRAFGNPNYASDEKPENNQTANISNIKSTYSFLSKKRFISELYKIYGSAKRRDGSPYANTIDFRVIVPAGKFKQYGEKAMNIDGAFFEYTVNRNDYFLVKDDSTAKMFDSKSAHSPLNSEGEFIVNIDKNAKINYENKIAKIRAMKKL